MRALLPVIFVTLTLSNSALADQLVCENGKDTRTLSLTETDGGCKLEYTKFGKTIEEASQKNGSNICHRVFENIRDKLVSSGYKCQ